MTSVVLAWVVVPCGPTLAREPACIAQSLTIQGPDSRLVAWFVRLVAAVVGAVFILVPLRVFVAALVLVVVGSRQNDVWT